MTKKRTSLPFTIAGLLPCLAVFLNANTVAAQQSSSRPIEFPAAVVDESPISAERVTDGWIALFDGRSLFGWREESEANWRVENGEIRVDEGQAGLLRTASQFDDFELHVEFACGEETNSGIFIRTSPSPTDPADDCYEINIAPRSNPFPTASLVARLKTGVDSPEQGSVQADSEKEEINSVEKFGEVKKFGEFGSLDIKAVGGRIQVWLNGNLMTDYFDERPLGRGYIGLQLNSGGVRFRNVWLKPLSVEPIFNHTDLTGWSVPGEGGFNCRVDSDGNLELSQGAGHVESTGQLANAVIQLKSRISDRGNSGVFFRCIPGEKMNGYESQIDNGMINEDRNQPSNGGTGGIFRRKDARRILADDNLWFAKTIVIEGPHIAVWVNGFQVTDWTDQRQDDPNPRRGRRLEAGSIMLQGHDAETTVWFREIAARELKTRR